MIKGGGGLGVIKGGGARGGLGGGMDQLGAWEDKGSEPCRSGVAPFS